MKNYIKEFFWNYINAGKGRFYVEDPQIPFLNGFSLVAFLTIVLFGGYRLVTGGYWVGIIDLTIAFILVLNVIYLRFSLRSKFATLVLVLSVGGIVVHTFYEGSVGGNTGIFWIYTVPVLMFFILGKIRGLILSLVFFMALIVVSALGFYEIISIPYSFTVATQAFISLAVLIAAMYLYADFTARNAQELEERTKSLREGFEIEKKSIKASGEQKEALLKEELDTFFKTTDEIMGIIKPDGTFAEINPAATKILGYPREYFLTNSYMSLVHPDDVAKTTQEAKKLIKEMSPSLNYVNRYRRQDGEYTYLMWNSTSHGGLIYATARVVDDLVAAQKKTEEKMKEVEELNRLMVGREVRMAELKEEIAALKQGKEGQGESAHL